MQAREADRRRGDARLARARADARRPRCGWSSCAGRGRALPAAARRASPAARPCTAGATGSARPSTSRAASRPARGPSTVLVSAGGPRRGRRRATSSPTPAARSSRASRRPSTRIGLEGPPMQRQQRLGTDPDRRLAAGARVADEPVRPRSASAGRPGRGAPRASWPPAATSALDRVGRRLRVQRAAAGEREAALRPLLAGEEARAAPRARRVRPAQHERLRGASRCRRSRSPRDRRR